MIRIQQMVRIGVCGLLVAAAFLYTQKFGTAAEDPAVMCASVPNERKQECYKQVAELNKQEAELEKLNTELGQQKQQTGSIQGDITKLQSDIKAKKGEIDKKTKLITKLVDSISTKNKMIADLTDELGRQEASMGRIMRNMNEIEEYTFTEFFASGKSVSDMFGDMDRFQTLQSRLYDVYGQVTELKELTAKEKEELQKKKESEANVKYSLEQDKKAVEKKEDEKQDLLAVSKNKEKSYEQVIAERKVQIAKIRASLFELRGQAGISFGDAYQFAKAAGQKTGVRPAFILAILKQESNMGKNVGTCNRPGDKLKWRDIMPGPDSGSWRDDQTVFLDITKRLGISPEGQPLSCPIIINGSPSGWGGAMGPSQFIPTTWKRYEARIAAAVGVTTANPWNPAHAIMATSLYVGDLGAGARTYTAEREAACKYYSGRGCSTPGVQNAFYGNAVMANAAAIQEQIDVLESV